MCHEASSVGLPEAIGVGKGTVQLEDFEQADAVFCIGHNPGTNHPRMRWLALASYDATETFLLCNRMLSTARVSRVIGVSTWRR